MQIVNVLFVHSYPMKMCSLNDNLYVLRYPLCGSPESFGQRSQGSQRVISWAYF